MPSKFATKRLLDSVWTLEYEQVQGGIKIISYSRDNNYGYDHENELERCRPVEDKNRTVTDVQFAEYDPFNFEPERIEKVVNPKYIFDYSE